MKREIRFISKSELRAAGDGDKPQISGYAAVFNQETRIGDFFTEIIKPGAFTRALKEKQDVRALFNHDADKVLGRSPKTLRLSEDSKGLKYEIDLPDTTTANDLRESIKRGDIDQSSFAFVAVKQTWREEGDQLIREIEDVDLYDVSPVTYPAYEGTSVSARSMFPDGEIEIPEEHRKKKDEPAPAISDAEFRERTDLKLRVAEKL
jgi:HK97 family phage prohead protease